MERRDANEGRMFTYTVTSRSLGEVAVSMTGETPGESPVPSRDVSVYGNAMFRDDRQVARALRVLLAPLHLGDLWTDTGPTDRAVELREEDGAALSSGERTMILAAWAFWNGSAPTLRFDALFGLDNANTEALCSLLVVLTQDEAAIEEWIARSEGRFIAGSRDPWCP